MSSSRRATRGLKFRLIIFNSFRQLELDGADIALNELAARSYGPSTSDAMLSYKKKRDIINRSYQTQADNIVGVMTMAALDNEMFANEGPSGGVPVVARCANGQCKVVRQVQIRRLRAGSEHRQRNNLADPTGAYSHCRGRFSPARSISFCDESKTEASSRPIQRSGQNEFTAARQSLRLLQVRQS